MNNLKRRNQIKWCIYCLLLPILYVMQTTPGFLSFGGVKPMLLIPLAVAVACFEQPLPSGVYAMFCGLFTDAAADYLLGFNAIILMFACVIISLVHTAYLKSKLADTLASCFLTLLLQRFLDYFFYYLIWGSDPDGWMLLHRFLPTAALSLVFCIPIYYLIRLIVVRLQKDDTDLMMIDS